MTDTATLARLELADLKTAWAAAKSARACSQMELRRYYDEATGFYLPGAAPFIDAHTAAISAQNAAYHAYVDALLCVDENAEVPTNY